MPIISQTLKILFLETIEKMIQKNLEESTIEEHDHFVVTKGRPQNDKYMMLDKVENGGVFYYLNMRIKK